MQIQDTKKLAEAIEEARRRYAESGSLDPDEITCSVMQGLALTDPDNWAVIRDDAAFRTIRADTVKSIQHALRVAANEDERQFLLPGFKRLARFVKVGDRFLDSGKLLHPEFQILLKECESRIDGYQYARRSSKAEKRDRELRRELRHFAPIFDRHASENPAISLEQARQLHESLAERARNPTGKPSR